MLTLSQRNILSSPPKLGQQEHEIINLLHTDPIWREAQLQDMRARMDDPGARYLTPIEVGHLLAGTPLSLDAGHYIAMTTLTILGSKPVVGGQPVEGYLPGVRIIFLAQGELERSIHTWSHVFAFDYLRQDGTLAKAFMEALYSWVVQDWWWRLRIWWDSLFDKGSERGRVFRLAEGYIYGVVGLPDGFWKGGQYTKNDAEEACASLASGIMGKLSLIPKSMKVFYQGLFD